MKFKLTAIPPPLRKEKRTLRLMIFVGVVSIVFFLYTMFQKETISYFPLYVLLMVSMVFYCLKYLHEWYHYFSIAADVRPVSDKLYTVDILTTYCAGEPFDMLEQTLTAIQNITYPHTAWCCDEADDPMVKALCQRLQVRHVTRVIKKDAKAGNINNALQYATGELCVVLDPDHIPTPEFLDQVVAYFDDPSIGFVQIVQAYYNQEESLVAKGAAQQTYQFYGPMMMGMHSYGTVQAIGANCTFRRAALDSIGGHASGLSEDMHTAMQLHAKHWRSVYVPAILTRGLVPATMSSYYKQQLKWSRGTWELLVTTYPRLFFKFTLRQKLHYLTLPFHYLSGFIFFINFLIPVICLFTGYIPLKMDMVSFLLASMPFFAMGILIRQYVQKWVAEEKERGFHIVGGILQIGTWWIHSVGFLYTIFRKKVPYIPTPKNDNDPLPVLLNLPNILIAVISMIAIVYGLINDYNPYTIFMVALASMQIVFMIFILSISGYVSDSNRANTVMTKLREKTWLIEFTHGFLRRYSLPLSFLLIAIFILGYRQQQKLPTFLPKPSPELAVFYRGLHLQPLPNATEKAMPGIAMAADRNDIAIISLNIPWGGGEKNELDSTFLQKVYNQRAIPLIALSLWQSDSATGKAFDNAVLNRIIAGKYDDHILSFARQVASLNKPVYLRFVNEPVQNKYPLFAATNHKPEDYIAAWQYVHQLFDQSGADKVMWVWNAMDAESASDYFPGNNYVDWLGVNMAIAQNGKLTKNPLSFDSLYRAYHLLPLFNSGLPVMVTQTIAHPANPERWWNATWKNMDTAFKEIKSVIIGAGDGTGGYQAIDTFSANTLNIIFSNAPAASLPILTKDRSLPKVALMKGNASLPSGIKSIVYDKGYYWFRNRHTMNLKTLEADVLSMKEIGINTIERSMPGYYDQNFNKVIVANGMNLIPKFGILGTPKYVDDDKLMSKQKEKILQVIKMNINKKHILAWNVGDDVLFSLYHQSYQPDYFYFQEKYLAWLADLCLNIRKIDSTRPIVMDLNWDINGRKRYKLYKKLVPQINTYRLVADAKYLIGLKQPLEKDMVWGKVAVELWPLVPSIRQSGTIPAWQDIENTDFITLNGLLDLEGRKKEWYGKVATAWGKKIIPKSPVPDIKILKPAKITMENTSLVYHVIFKNTKSQWRLYDNEINNLRFEWYLVRVDQYDNTMFIKKVGEGATIHLSIPMEPQYYRLYVEAVLGEDIKTVNTTLNTALY